MHQSSQTKAQNTTAIHAWTPPKGSECQCWSKGHPQSLSHRCTAEAYQNRKKKCACNLYERRIPLPPMWTHPERPICIYLQDISKIIQIITSRSMMPQRTKWRGLGVPVRARQSVYRRMNACAAVRVLVYQHERSNRCISASAATSVSMYRCEGGNRSIGVSVRARQSVYRCIGARAAIGVSVYLPERQIARSCRWHGTACSWWKNTS